MDANSVSQDQGHEQESVFSDLSALRLGQNFAGSAGVKPVVTTVPVDKPHKQQFVRVRPGADWRIDAAILELDETRERYLVLPTLHAELAEELKPVCLRTCINRQGIVSLWPLRLPSDNRRGDRWAESAIEAAKLAEKKWVRVVPIMESGLYVPYQATADIPEPEWPELSFNRLLELAFRGCVVDSLDHPVIKRLREGA